MLRGLITDHMLLMRSVVRQAISLPASITHIECAQISASDLHRGPLLQHQESLHTSSTSLAQQPTDKAEASTTSTTATASPLANLEERLKALQKQQGPTSQLELAERLAPITPPVSQRTWRWYNQQDEKEWQRMELNRQYTDAGYAYLQHVPTSVKKMDRIIRIVRGLPVDEASSQLQALPHKAARYLQQILDHALDDAEEKKLPLDNLVVDTLYVTKGMYTNQKPHYRAKGRTDMIKSRTCHVKMLLRELPVPYRGFKTRMIPHAVQPPASALASKPLIAGKQTQDDDNVVVLTPVQNLEQQQKSSVFKTASGKVLPRYRQL